jgi:3-oxoacyl-[acyl-carrier protein] reductase
MKSVIFGASSDIGIAICAKYLEMGWDVIAVYRSERKDLFDLKQKSPSRIEFIQHTFNGADSLKNHLEENRSVYSLCDAVVNCVGIANPKKYEDILESDVLEHIRINTIPNIVLTQFFSKFMLERAWGRFVYISSIGVKFSGGAENYCYSMSKLLTEFFPSVAKKDWARENVFVNAVRAGYIDTRFHSQSTTKSPSERISLIPAKRAGKPTEVAEAVFFLGSERNTFTTCEILAVAGGE